MHTKNRFLQGIFQFTGEGINKPAPLDATLSYVVPDGSIAQALYFRGGNTADELVALVLMRDGVPMRYFPMGAKADVHVPLRVVEDLEGAEVAQRKALDVEQVGLIPGEGQECAFAERADDVGGGGPLHGGEKDTISCRELPTGSDYGIRGRPTEGGRKKGRGRR